MLINVCATCDERFTKPHNPNRPYKFCSIECSTSNTRKREQHSKIMAGRSSWNKGMTGRQHWMNTDGLLPGWNKGIKTGIVPPNKKPDVFITCLQCRILLKVKPAISQRKKYCSKSCKHAAQTQDLSIKGQIRRLRASTEYRQWRTAVFKRDDYTCQDCGVRGGRLNADHIKRFADFPDLRFDVSNGRTLCEGCHRKTPTYGNRRCMASGSA
jgi:5-methylcytosine-specific restriction endonuclease McrA